MLVSCKYLDIFKQLTKTSYVLSVFSKFPIEILIFSPILVDFAIFSIGRQITIVDFHKLYEPILESAWPGLSPREKGESFEVPTLDPPLPP